MQQRKPLHYTHVTSSHVGHFPTGHQTHAATAQIPGKGRCSMTLTRHFLCAATNWELHAEAEAWSVTMQKEKKSKTGQRGVREKGRECGMRWIQILHCK